MQAPQPAPNMTLIISASVVMVIILALLAWFLIYFLGGKNKAAWKESLKWIAIIAGGVIVGALFTSIFGMLFNLVFQLIGAGGM